MHLLMLAFSSLLFFLLTPGILVTLPRRGSKVVVALTHAVVFASLYHLTHHAVWQFVSSLDGFKERFANSPNMPMLPPKPGAPMLTPKAVAPIVLPKPVAPMLPSNLRMTTAKY
jgi:hypothetical protein